MKNDLHVVGGKGVEKVDLQQDFQAVNIEEDGDDDDNMDTYCVR